MIPKVEWAALLEAADHVRALPFARAPPSPDRFAPGPGWGCPGVMRVSCPQLRLVEVPKGPVQGYEQDETFLRKMHHVLLEVRLGPAATCLLAAQPHPEAAGAQLFPAGDGEHIV